ncbi:transmembrane channel-like protein 3 [Chelonus insularis]|uniref:transmembrane channel-like protein 3 n=1 Tax=Chelonus insularis TaxID=460826 RepID=UPI001589C0EE|nr:transmembrane channel-like protein 3 [Chelonus insularis]
MSEDHFGAGILKMKKPRLSKNLPQSETPIQETTEKPSVKFILTEEVQKEPEKKVINEECVQEEMPISPTILSLGQTHPAINGESDDYSASVSVMLNKKTLRRSLSKRKKLRSSSFAHDDYVDTPGRRSSVFTTSSGDTAISMDGEEDENIGQNGVQELIFEKLKIHKEALSAVKYQPWPLQKKIKLVRQAKSYIRKHEGALQERLAHTKSTRDALARASIFFSKTMQRCKREIINLETWMIPWELRIKEIESHFGSAVASYFIFLRWLFWINFVIFLTLTAFVVIPEVLTAKIDKAGDRKILFPEEVDSSKNFLTWWEFEGILKHSPFFYGWYTNSDPTNGGYRLPLAYFLANLVVYTYSFVAILQKMAKNSRMSKLSEKEDECVFSWKLFTGWDFMIGNPETAANRVSSNILSFKEALLEEAEKEKKLGHWKITTVRILVNLLVISLLVLSAYAVVEVVLRSTQIDANSGWWRQNEITIVMSLISYIFPIFFEILGFLENYHPRKQLRLQLARIMVLNLLNLYSLIFALFDKISHMEVELQSLKPKIPKNFIPSNFSVSHCEKYSVPCTEPSFSNLISKSFQSSTQTPPKSSALTLSIAAMSLMLMPNMTTNHSIVFKNGLEPRIKEEEETLVPYDDVKWEVYNERNIPQNNFEYYDSYTDDFSYGDKESTVAGKNTVESSTVTTSEKYSRWSDTEEILFTKELNQNKSPEDRGSIELTTDNQIFTSTTPRKPRKPKIKMNVVQCFARVCDIHQDNEESHEFKRYRNTRVSHDAISSLNMTTKRKLRRLCWETMFGQELAKLTVMDLILTIIATLIVDFFRALFVRYMNPWWCWDLEKQFPQYGDFKIAENILHLVNNQGMVWMGLFFSPGLIALNLVKLGILMYLRSWAVMTCNVPHEIVFRASRSNNFYFALLLIMIFLCVLPVGYAIVWVEPSWHCGPFAGYYRIYYIASQSLKDVLPKKIHKALDYIASPGIIIPLIVLMALIIYYMISLASSLREANNDLKIQLRYERTEERRKMFKIAEKQSQGQTGPFARWKKIFPMKSFSSTDNSVAKTVGNALNQRRRYAVDEVRSITSDPDEATDIEPNSLLQDSLSPKDVSDIDHQNFLFCNNRNNQVTEIPRIRIDTIDKGSDQEKDEIE